ncbi:hypothetical protein KIN20_021935 [Parelaphostrongylus tenuis]|uniref:Uncharacterized protein n=1 Tax=Parelaphostrongylus tenuis TaxID=148309 RepID=A0AAD5N7J1_PARTN|nr:hypothetical protein KIN20_021935 [Parelaphostrongylus tenuis]
MIAISNAYDTVEASQVITISLEKIDVRPDLKQKYKSHGRSKDHHWERVSANAMQDYASAQSTFDAALN